VEFSQLRKLVELVCFPTCQSEGSSGFFHFPKNPSMQALWLENSAFSKSLSAAILLNRKLIVPYGISLPDSTIALISFGVLAKGISTIKMH
jgi:hypothetical protein